MLTNLLKQGSRNLFDKAASSEIYASHLYQYLANQMQRFGLSGAQSFFLKESADELAHYNKLVDFVNDMGDVLLMPAVELINDTVSGIASALDIAYETEVELLRFYEGMYEILCDLKDVSSATFIIKFVQIQRKSVGEYGDLISRLNQNPLDIFEFDNFLSNK